MEYQLINSVKANTKIEQIFINRGFASQDIQHYLNTTDKDILDPLLLKNMQQGAQMLIRHINNGDKIFIQVDGDCDGFTSAASLLNYLYKLFPSFVENNIQYRFHEGKQHGLILETIPKDVKLVIAPDSSSMDYEVHKELFNRGVDVLILDHHSADRESEHACVINNQLCNYPTKSLSGAGIVYKFCSFLDNCLSEKYSEDILDLVALGLIADVMDLRDFETRRIIEKGIQNIKNPFMKTMIEKNSFSLGDEITPIGIAFYIAPYVNAIVRMGSQSDKELIFKSMLFYEGDKLIPSTKRGCAGQVESCVEQACRTCVNVKRKQTIARDTASEIIQNIIEEQELNKNKILLVQLSKELDINHNLTGLIANCLMDKYQKPVMLLHEGEDRKWEGSCRGCNGSKLDNFRQFLLDSKLVEYAQGHASAFGSGVQEEKIKALIDYANEQLQDFSFDPSYKVDFIFSPTNFSSDDIIEIADLKPYYGQGIAEPFIAIENIIVHKDNIQLMSADRNPTLKVNLSNGVSLIKFKSSKEEYEKLVNGQGSSVINIVGRCSKNVWNSNVSAQILIEDYEITKQVKFYF